MDQLLDRILSLLGIVRIAIEVLADHNVGGQLAPSRGDLAVGLLEKDLAILVLDRRAAGLPFHGLKRIRNTRGTKTRFDPQSAAVASNLLGRSSSSSTFASDFCGCHAWN